MKIGVDLDDVLAECVKSLVKFHNKRYSSNHTKDDITEHGLTVWQVPKEEVAKRVDEFYDSPFFDQIKPIAGAQKGINDLKQKHELIVVTSRPVRIEKQTRTWLDKYFPDSFLDVYFAGNHLGFNKASKIDICQQIGAGLLIEDAPGYIDECAQAGIRTLLYDQPWNKNYQLPNCSHRIHNWPEIRRFIESTFKGDQDVF